MTTLTPREWPSARRRRSSSGTGGQARHRRRPRRSPARSPCLGREERRAADPVRGAAHRRAARAHARAAAQRRAHDAHAARADGRAHRGARRAARSTLEAARIEWPLAPYELVKTMRASILVLGPAARALRRGARLAARRLRDRPAAGRPARQGARGDGRRDRPRPRLHRRDARRACSGARFVFDVVTVTGTENLLMAATLAEGTTRARERGARAGGRRPGGLPRRRWARASRAPAPTGSSIEGVDRAARRDAPDHARPHRDRHVPRGGRR